MQTKVATELVVVNEQGDILLLHRSRCDNRRPLQWDVPGGHLDEGEQLEAAATREAREEANLELQTDNLKLVYSHSKTFPDEVNVVWLFFVARAPREAIIKLSSEHDDYRWTSITEAISLIEYDVQKTALRYIAEHGLHEAA